MAEWLGSALQKLLQRFESASDLIVKMESPVVTQTVGLLLFCVLPKCLHVALKLIVSRSLRSREARAEDGLRRSQFNVLRLIPSSLAGKAKI